MKKEIWKIIPSYPAYEASSTGKIRSKNKILTACLTTSGYHHVCLSVNKRPKTQYVHRLVAEAFHPIANSKFLIVNHKNGNKLDNRPENLEWCTKEENRLHSILFNNHDTSSSIYDLVVRLDALPKEKQKEVMLSWKSVLEVLE